MYCPQCGAEYRPGFTVCSDCQVDLVPELPRESSAEAPIDGTSFTLVWAGDDAGKHTEICEALDREKIPARTLGSEDHLFNLTTRPAYEVYVPVDLTNSAQEVIKQIDAVEGSEEPSESDVFEIPAEDDAPNGDYEEDEQRSASQNLDPQDATVEIWSGEDTELAAMITSSLRENHIVFHSDPDASEPDPGINEPESASDKTRPAAVFVFPEDERRGKEIVREIVNAVPPE